MNSLERLVITEHGRDEFVRSLRECYKIVSYFPVEIRAFGTVFVVDSQAEIDSLIEDLNKL